MPRMVRPSLRRTDTARYDACDSKPRAPARSEADPELRSAASIWLSLRSRPRFVRSGPRIPPIPFTMWHWAQLPWPKKTAGRLPGCPPADDVPPRPESDPQPLPHLRAGGDSAFCITLEVWLRSARMQQPMLVSRADFPSLYWTLAQMVAHHASNGCPLRPGDLIGSGTVSGPGKQNRGCLLEMTWRGTEPLELPTGEVRRFLEDGDEVILRGWCEKPGFRRIGIGECRGVILPAIS